MDDIHAQVRHRHTHTCYYIISSIVGSISIINYPMITIDSEHSSDKCRGTYMIDHLVLFYMKYESHPLSGRSRDRSTNLTTTLCPPPFFCCPAQLLSLHAPLLSSHNIAPSSLPLPSSLYLGQWWEDASLPTILKYPDHITTAQAQQVRAMPH